MPVITLNLDPLLGPIVYAYLGVSGPHREALTKAGGMVPALVQGRFLIDTGASSSAVDPTTIAPLNLQPTGAIMCHTPSTQGVPQAMPTYDVSVLIPCGDDDAPLYLPAIGVSCSGFKAQGIDGLIGRDILAKCHLTYNGQIGQFTLAY